MSSRLNGASLFTQAISGLSQNYAKLMTGNKTGGLTLENITNPTDEVKESGLNSAFSSYLTTNFGALDKDGDGKISATEMQTQQTNMSQGGMTYEQISQLCAQGSSTTLLETVLNNFKAIDKDGNGKVTNQEIAAYGMDEEIKEMKDKFPKHDLKGMSVFYDTSSSTSTSSTEEA